MKKMQRSQMCSINGGTSAWVCGYYTAVTLFTTVFTVLGGVFLAGFTAACWAHVD